MYGPFLTGLRDGRILGIRRGGDVLCPPTEWDPATSGNSPNTCASHPADMCYQNSDCPSGDSCSGAPPALQHPVTGAWQWSFYANTIASGASCKGSLNRGSTTYFNSTIALTGDGKWHQYTYKLYGH